METVTAYCVLSDPGFVTRIENVLIDRRSLHQQLIILSFRSVLLPCDQAFYETLHVLRRTGRDGDRCSHSAVQKSRILRVLQTTHSHCEVPRMPIWSTSHLKYPQSYDTGWKRMTINLMIYFYTCNNNCSIPLFRSWNAPQSKSRYCDFSRIACRGAGVVCVACTTCVLLASKHPSRVINYRVEQFSCGPTVVHMIVV